MTSPAVHLTTGSVPSDYALLSQYAAHRGLGAAEDNEQTPLLHRRPSKPTMATIPTASDNTPLINPAIPRIDEHLPADDEYTKERAMYWEEFRILTRYGLPVFGTHLLEYSFVVTSVLSVGHLSTTALAAITLGSMTANVSGLSIIQGFSSALDTMLPSAWTSSQPRLVGLWCQRMVVVMAVLCIPIMSVWLNAEAILLAVKQDPEVAHLAAVYLRWLTLGLPAYAFNSISRRYFQSQGLFAAPTRINFIVAPINVVLNYLLVWGPDAIRLGFIGAPIATAISFNLVSILSICYGLFYTAPTAWHPLSHRMVTSLPILVKLGLGGVGQVASEWWAWELVGLSASLQVILHLDRLGPVALATQSVLLVSCSTTYQAPFALSIASSVRIGNLLGEGNAKRAGVASNTSLLMSLLISAVSCSILFGLRNVWGWLFTDSQEVVDTAAKILPLVAIFQVFDGGAGVTSGILRARGMQITGAVLNLTAYYAIGIPLGLLLTFKAGMGLHGLWLGLTVSLVYCAVAGSWICVRTNWELEVQKVLERLEEEKRKREAEDAVERGE
ncbi:MATE efflux family protein [Cylindrobasidium torrendii FP15055 ss-10]|uniref:MATE efflux family protein n=1 Tax=Cylindrobasidium torrendii FP15055 ss-10 TaxID=1314674 RepID=A0A0D7B5J1_9AGAR|nr:MATE efflux family protein [Cylindrobasidium torrendii FP15055 ss-10]